MPERPVPEIPVTPVKSPRRKVKISDVLIFVVLAAVILFLIHMLISQLNLKHEAASARTATNGFLTDISKQDSAAAYKFGDAAFEAKYTQKELANLFKSLAPLVKNHPTIVKQTVTNGKVAQVVSVYYKFDKPTYFFAITIKRANGTDKWELINFSGSPKQADLYKTQ